MTTAEHRESVMVCVYYGPHGQRLIQRGSQLAKLLRAPFTVLTVDSSKENEYNEDKEQYLKAWEKMCRDSGGEFLVRKSRGRKAADVIIETAREKGVTQIIIGQSGQTFWQSFTKGNFVNELVERLGLIDLHIVAVQRYEALLEETHEEGVQAILVKNGEKYELNYSGEAVETEFMRGTFFKELHTDFNNGLFKTQLNGEPQYLKIVHGEWTERRP
ncbi:universal stress protein [Paenibacillus antibioticophila]|uniref:universal stress protein n=1 Tax=Paenibacillus antibioticophila TaxID=1274374 RepID=UPI0005CAF924|nr:universal stress protein [Paenibacillus antibioticophila]